MSSPPFLVTTNEAAALLRVCRATVYNLIARGELRVVHIGRSVRVPISEITRLTTVDAGVAA